MGLRRFHMSTPLTLLRIEGTESEGGCKTYEGKEPNPLATRAGSWSLRVG